MKRYAVLVAAVLVLVLVGGLGWWMLREPTTPAPAPAQADPPQARTERRTPPATVSPGASLKARPTPKKAVSTPLDCTHPPTKPFAPIAATVPGVITRATVLARPYDANGVPGVAPLSAAGRVSFAWEPTIRANSAQGNVLLNAHTWPGGGALGNWLAGGLREGGRIALHGARGQTLCYGVTDRVQVPGDQPYARYFATDGPPQVAIVVCSGTRLGPGRWTHRTVWFASPVR